MNRGKKWSAICAIAVTMPLLSSKLLAESPRVVAAARVARLGCGRMILGLAFGIAAVVADRAAAWNHARVAHRCGCKSRRRTVTDVAGHCASECRGDRDMAGSHSFRRCPVMASTASACGDAGVAEGCRCPCSRLVADVARLCGQHMIGGLARG